MDWKEEYKKRLVSAEDAVQAVKSGDYVVFAQPEAPALGLAGGIGALKVGHAGDVTVLDLLTGSFEYKDATRQSLWGKYKLTPSLTVKAGSTVDRGS